MLNTVQLLHHVVKQLTQVKVITLSRQGRGSAAPQRPWVRDEQAGRFVEQAAATFVDLGFARMPARVLMLLMCSEESGLTAADLAVGLHVSPAAVS
jgi:hypothetical protein